MNHRGTQALLALFFLGLGGLWLAEYARIPTRRDLDRQRSRVLPELIDLKPDDLRKIEIAGGTQPIVFERNPDGGWQMTAPSDVAADPSKVETLAFNLKELARKPEADTLQGDPASFGLAPPERTVRLWGRATDAPLAALELGKTSLDRRYVRAVGTEGVEVVDARMLDLVRLPWVRWRDHELIRVPSFEVDAVRLAGPKGEVRLRRDPDAWRVVAPLKVLAAETRVDGLIADLGTLRVLDDTRFVADDVPESDLDRFGLKTPALTIEVDAGRDGRRRPRQVLHVGKPVEGKEGQVYVRRGDQDEVVAVDSRVLRDISVDPNAFRSPKVADLNPARVVRIGVEAGGRSFEVARSGREWSIVRPSPALADRQAIESFLKSLGELQTTIYLAPAAVPDSGLDKPSMTLKVWQLADPRTPAAPGSADPTGTLALSLKIGRRDAGRKVFYSQIEGDRTILALPDSAGDFLPRSPLAFRDRRILSVPPEQVERVAMTGPTRKFALQAPVIKLEPLANFPVGWWMVDPVTAPADAPAVGKLLGLLGGLRAEILVSEEPGDLKPYGLDVPALTVTWATIPHFSMVPAPARPGPDGATTDETSLAIGAAVPNRPGQRFARVVGRPLVFTIGPEAIATIDAEFHDHRALSFDPDRVRRVQLDWPDRSVPLVRTGGEWKFEGAVDAPGFVPGLVVPLLKAASALSTPRFGQYVGPFPDRVGLASPRLSIRVELDDGSPSRAIRIGGPAGQNQLFATTAEGPEGPVFVVPGNLFSGWVRPPRQHDDLPDDVFAPGS